MKSPELKERLEESEKLIQEMTVTWEEKLRKTEEIAQVGCFFFFFPFDVYKQWVCFLCLSVHSDCLNLSPHLWVSRSSLLPFRKASLNSCDSWMPLRLLF